MLRVSDEDPYLGKYLREQQEKDPVWQAKEKRRKEREREIEKQNHLAEMVRHEAERKKQARYDRDQLLVKLFILYPIGALLFWWVASILQGLNVHDLLIILIIMVVAVGYSKGK